MGTALLNPAMDGNKSDAFICIVHIACCLSRHHSVLQLVWEQLHSANGRRDVRRRHDEEQVSLLCCSFHLVTLSRMRFWKKPIRKPKRMAAKWSSWCSQTRTIPRAPCTRWTRCGPSLRSVDATPFTWCVLGAPQWDRSCPTRSTRSPWSRNPLRSALFARWVIRRRPRARTRSCRSPNWSRMTPFRTMSPS